MSANPDLPRVLLLGGSGFVGSRICKFLEPSNKLQYNAFLAPGVNALRVDIGSALDLFTLVREFKPELIINCTGVLRGSLEDMQRVHVQGTRNLVAAARAVDARVISFGSCAEYGFDVPMPAREDGPCKPVSDYGKTKLEATQILLDGLEKVTVLRPSNVIGAGCKPPMLLGSILEQIKQGKNPIRVSDPNTVRDYVDVTDIAFRVSDFSIYLRYGSEEFAVLNAPETRKKNYLLGSGEFSLDSVYPKLLNLSSGVGTSNRELVELACRIAKVKTEVTYDEPDSQGTIFVASTDRACNELMPRWWPLFSLEHSVIAAWGAMQ